ncbi:MAG: putative glycoside hydrolase [Ruminiclostridium sp.]|nr:putative glycoside hydrolase [Ruminiclostridium sp.]
MKRNERMNIIVGLLVIVLAITGITILLFEFLGQDAQNANGAQGANETTQSASTVAKPDPTTVSSTPSSTPVPTIPALPTEAPTPTPGSSTASIPVKGLYLTPNSVATKERLQHYVDLANTTEINAYVVDVKDDLGEICYETNVPLAIKHDAWKKKYDVKQMLDLFHENNIKVIGRVVCFSDPLMPLKEPDMSLKNANGTVFKVPLNNSHLAWLDPSNEVAWQYLIDISKEALELGFDEIQYDYIRFPETTNFKYDMSYLEKEKSDYINGFMKSAMNQLDGILSGDIFGSVCIQSRDAGGLGQTLETISRQFDYISPMIYPSHYANDSDHYSGNKVGTNINGVHYKKPDLEPYNIIYNTLLIAKKRLTDGGLDIKVRPYLQGFTADYMPDGYFIKYGVDEYRAQIKAVYDAGYSEWIFWNSRNTYIEKAFLPEE